jgi:prolyl 4-hydroxylase
LWTTAKVWPSQTEASFHQSIIFFAWDAVELTMMMAASSTAAAADSAKQPGSTEDQNSSSDTGEGFNLVSPEAGSMEEETEDQRITTAAERPKRQRRSSRDTNRIKLSSSRHGALQFRRMEELFFNESDSSSSRPRRASASKLHQPPNKIVKVGKFSLERVFAAPNIYVVDNFLSENDLDYLQECIRRGQFQKSYVDKMMNQNSSSAAEGSILDQSHRTSTFLSFTKQENANIAAIERKAAYLMGCYSTDQIEPLQLVRYLPGQFFDAHHDMGDYNEETGHVELPSKSVLVKRRLVTIFCYLNDLEDSQGGCTGFPLCDHLQVKPQKGRAAVFCNVTAQGLPDPRTIHAGETVIDTRSESEAKTKKKPVKYGLNIWICES